MESSEETPAVKSSCRENLQTPPSSQKLGYESQTAEVTTATPTPTHSKIPEAIITGDNDDDNVILIPAIRKGKISDDQCLPYMTATPPTKKNKTETKTTKY